MILHLRTMLEGQGRHLSFHTPGHKRQGADVTELSYTDNLFSPKGVIWKAETDAAKILGAERSFFLTDGSTSGVFAMLYALRETGRRRIAVPQNAHRSVYNACNILQLEVIPVAQRAEYGILCPPSEEDLAAALLSADALLLTSPDYYGYFPPLAAASSLCRAAKKPLLIDGAHGSHLHFTPMHASHFADMWVDGVHKSLPALTQGAVVSAKRAYFVPFLQDGVRIFRTTSPSYPILASVEYAVKYPRNTRIEERALRAREEVGALQNDDWTKLVVPFGAQARAAEETLEKVGIYPEFNDGNYLMFYLSPCTKEEEVDELVRVLQALPRGKVASDAPVGVMPLYAERK